MCLSADLKDNHALRELRNMAIQPSMASSFRPAARRVGWGFLITVIASLVVSSLAPSPLWAARPWPQPPRPVNPFAMLLIVRDWPWSTPSGWAQTVDLIARMGNSQARVPVNWAISEPRPGQIRFDTTNDERIQSVEAQGMRPLVTLFVGCGWMNGCSLNGSRSYPPSDLSSVWHPQYGYSRSYYTFVKQFITHYRGHFDFVAIENEVNSSLFWGGTADEYLRLIRTAYKAIKEADPNVQVIDSGMVSGMWGLCIARDWLASGYRSEAETMQMALAYYRRAAQTGVIPIRTAQDVRFWLAQPAVQQNCDMVTTILSRLQGTVDALNFHFYEDYSVMHYVTEWIDRRTQMAGYTRPRLTNEIGQRGDLAYAQGAQHARDVFKTLITAASLNLQAVTWFSGNLRDQPIAELFEGDGNWRPAAFTYWLVVNTLQNQYRFQSAAATGPALYRYIFQDVATGQPTLEAAWAEGDSQPVTLMAPVGSTAATVTDYQGIQQVYPVENGQITLTIGDPVFIHWQ